MVESLQCMTKSPSGGVFHSAHRKCPEQREEIHDTVVIKLRQGQGLAVRMWRVKTHVSCLVVDIALPMGDMADFMTSLSVLCCPRANLVRRSIWCRGLSFVFPMN